MFKIHFIGTVLYVVGVGVVGARLSVSLTAWHTKANKCVHHIHLFLNVCLH